MVDTVIDISHYQAGIDLPTFRAAGGLAVIAKATQGTTIADPSFGGFASSAEAVGLAFASYHYLTTDDPAQQASFYIATAVPPPGGRVCVDWEGAGVTAANVVSFLKAVALMRPDLQLTVYCDPATAATIDSASATWLKANTSLWIAEYGVSKPTVPAPWTTWSLWQYSDDATNPGYSGQMDANKFNGSNGNLIKWFGPASAPSPAPSPSPNPAPSPAIVSITVSGNVTLTVNGKTVPVSPQSTA
jgi:lysozyme